MGRGRSGGAKRIMPPSPSTRIYRPAHLRHGLAGCASASRRRGRAATLLDTGRPPPTAHPSARGESLSAAMPPARPRAPVDGATSSAMRAAESISSARRCAPRCAWKKIGDRRRRSARLFSTRPDKPAPIVCCTSSTLPIGPVRALPRWPLWWIRPPPKAIPSRCTFSRAPRRNWRCWRRRCARHCGGPANLWTWRTSAAYSRASVSSNGIACWWNWRRGTATPPLLRGPAEGALLEALRSAGIQTRLL